MHEATPPDDGFHEDAGRRVGSMHERDRGDGHAARAALGEGHHAAHVSKAVVRSLYEAAGSSALYVDCPIEQAHRDVHAVMQHVVFAPLWLEAAGQVRLGLTPQNPIF